MKNKREGWEEYYVHFLEQAATSGRSPLDIQDEEYNAPSQRLMSRLVLPHVREEHTVLEIGSGIGRLSRFSAPRCRKLVCADLIEGALETARKLLSDCRNIEYQPINGYDLSPLRAEQFDVAYSFGTFFHFDFELVVQYFCEIRRVLKRGGVGVLEFKSLTPKALDVLLEKLDSRGIAWCEEHSGKFRYVSSDMLRVLCERLQLKILDEDFSAVTFEKVDAD